MYRVKIQIIILKLSEELVNSLNIEMNMNSVIMIC